MAFIIIVAAIALYEAYQARVHKTREEELAKQVVDQDVKIRQTQEALLREQLAELEAKRAQAIARGEADKAADLAKQVEEKNRRVEDLQA